MSLISLFMASFPCSFIIGGIDHHTLGSIFITFCIIIRRPDSLAGTIYVARVLFVIFSDCDAVLNIDSTFSTG